MMDKKLRALVAAEQAAWDALLSDPQVIANPSAGHTPALKEAWIAAAEAERDYRQALGIYEPGGGIKTGITLIRQEGAE